MRRLAHDDIAVARSVLARSTRLTDQDLVSVAVTRGRDHMLAISERSTLSEPVTDVLVTRGDRVVVNALASNQGAAFSHESLEMLVEKAREDELLHAALRSRADMPAHSVVTLVAIAKDYARKRLERTAGMVASEQMEKILESSASVVAQSAGAGPQPRNFSAAVRRVAERLAEGKLCERDVLEYARAKQFEETVCALAALASVSVPMVTRIFATGENDMLLVIGRTLSFEWSTVRQLIQLSSGAKPSERASQATGENYARLSPATADRVLRFMHMREAAKVKSVGKRA